MKGFPLNESVEKGVPFKNDILPLLARKTVADKYRHAAYHNKH